MAYAGVPNKTLMTLLAFAISTQFRGIPPPSKTYNLSDGTHPSHSVITELVSEYALPLEFCPIVQRPGESGKKFKNRRRREYSEACQSRAALIATTVLAHWPTNIPALSDEYFQPDPTTYQQAVKALFSSCLNNSYLETFAIDVQTHLQNLRVAALEPLLFTTPLGTSAPVHVAGTGRLCTPGSLIQLLQQRDAPTAVQSLSPPKLPILIPSVQSPTSKRPSRLRDARLNALVNEIICTDKPLLWKYGQALASSQDSLRQEHPLPASASMDTGWLVQELTKYLEECTEYTSTVFSSLADALSAKNEVGNMLGLMHHWPRTNPRDLLALLSYKAVIALPGDRWPRAIRFFAACLMRLQQAQRLLDLALVEAFDDLAMELRNEITDEVLSTEPADWLLIQIQGNFYGRTVQRSVAKEMVSPRDDCNTLLQLNMGEGKTSVIVPLVASSLANGSNLVRIVVLKPLAKAMFALLVQRLTGLVNRRIFYLPISRDLRLNDSDVQRLSTLFRTCAQEGGVLVAQPEHILSFKLMGIDLAKDDGGQDALLNRANILLDTQRWLSVHSRDILDESDEVLSVQYSLVYTTGRQIPFENHPDRWLIIQEMLHWLKEEAVILFSANPDGLQVEIGLQSSFPVIRILNSQIGQQLVNRVAERCINSARLRLLPTYIRDQAMDFISDPDVDDIDITTLKNELPSTLWNYLLVIRGFIGHGILQFILEQKRWRVNYGLDQSRTLLAVPYRAKDVPAIRADFGHPDVAIGLTCLSYHYTGLTPEQLEQCFRILLKLDNPIPVYETWIAAYDAIPVNLHQVAGINLDDVEQIENVLFPLFRKHQVVVDFYLSRVVFPKEAKQFPSKLATSSWDLAEIKTNVTTGFSGTNDNQDLLPTTISQRDPLNQVGTNARVLSHLLHPENDHYQVLDGRGHLLSSRDFLEHIVNESPPVRVLLDVGAQMLDMQSLEIAQTWLSMEPAVEGIVFFNEADQLVVMRRDQSVEPLDSTPYSQSLELCAIYLDDAHTRGTDLKFPRDFRAAVTLGSKLTKDRLVQGCMRMRKLGHGHSVVFLAPPEVDTAIRSLAGPDTGGVSIADILRWTIRGTCEQIVRHLPHWAEQGVDYHQRNSAWMKYTSDPSTPTALAEMRAAWESPDAQTLEQMYCQSSSTKQIQHGAHQITGMRGHLEMLGLDLDLRMQLDEEQEREVHYEIEKERQVERPPQAEPAEHHVHEHLFDLVQTGVFVAQSPAFVPLFSSLNNVGKHVWSPNLLSTKEFATTIIDSAASNSDYLRPVHWILTVKADSRLVVLSPFEANELLPSILTSRFVHLHVYAARVNESMGPMDDLRFYVVPPLPEDWKEPLAVDVAQLNLWAGQLYFKDLSAFTKLRLILGIVGEEAKSSESQYWEADGFVRPWNRQGDMKKMCKILRSPIPFLKELINLRQKGVPFDKTHMGKFLDGHLLTEKDFRYRQTTSIQNIV